MNDSLYMVFLQKQTIGTENRSMVVRGWRWQKGLITKGQKDILGADGTLLYLHCGYKTVYICQNSHYKG